MSLRNRIKQWLGLTPSVESSPTAPHRGSQDHVIILDGTMSSLAEGCETNAGLLYKLLCEVAPVKSLSLRYEAGIQWHSWKNSMDVIEGRGINRQIQRVYGFIASRYRPGDRIFLFGYSRGAYAVRSLAGMIGAVGLLRQEMATERNIHRAFRLYAAADSPRIALRRAAFAAERSQNHTEIEMLGVWDTVRALGLPFPVLSRLAPMATEFHDHALAPHIRHGYQALAIDEDRGAFAPILWQRSRDWQGRLEQAWFPGVHGDIGGDVRDHTAARPFGNLSLNWMLRRAARHGLVLPPVWESRFDEDPTAPTVGRTRGAGRFYLIRQPRVTGRGDGETIHLSIRERMAKLPGYRPRGRIEG